MAAHDLRERLEGRIEHRGVVAPQETGQARHGLTRAQVTQRGTGEEDEVALVPLEPRGQHRSDLVAEGWKRPLLLAAEEVASPSVDKSSLVPELDHQLVVLPGYMRPVVREGKLAEAHDHEHVHEDLSAGQRVSEFLLVPFLPQHPCQHSLWDPNQVVLVRLLEPVQIEDPDDPVWVVGTMTLDTVMTDDGLSAYRIAAAVTTPYEY